MPGQRRFEPLELGDLIQALYEWTWKQTKLMSRFQVPVSDLLHFGAKSQGLNSTWTTITLGTCLHGGNPGNLCCFTVKLKSETISFFGRFRCMNRLKSIWFWFSPHQVGQHFVGFEGAFKGWKLNTRGLSAILADSRMTRQRKLEKTWKNYKFQPTTVLQETIDEP